MAYSVEVYDKDRVSLDEIYPSLNISVLEPEYVHPQRLHNLPRVTVDEDNFILQNHRTYLAYRNVDQQYIDVTVVEGLTEDQKSALVKLDQEANTGTFDKGLLDTERD